MSESENPVLISVSNHVGHLTLNRPASLNTLTLPMIRILQRQLQAWEDDPQIHAVVLRGAGDRAFCAGGDIRALYESQKKDDPLHRDFFNEEYALDYYIHTYPKPILALLNGLVLGGGMGLAQGASICIVTESARLGMPEVAIGFFPDIGSGYFLPRLPGELGTYLGVTGTVIDAADALYCGLADVCVPNAEIPRLDAALDSLDWGEAPATALGRMLDSLAEPSLPATSLETLEPAIDEHFGYASVPEIRRSLLGEDRPQYQEWAAQTVRDMDNRSPIAMAVTLEHLRRGRTQSLKECVSQELILAHNFLKTRDFMEGIRALLIDKDKKPRWNPARLEAVTPEQVAAFFQKD